MSPSRYTVLGKPRIHGGDPLLPPVQADPPCTKPPHLHSTFKVAQKVGFPGKSRLLTVIIYITDISVWKKYLCPPSSLLLSREDVHRDWGLEQCHWPGTPPLHCPPNPHQGSR